MKKRLTTVMLCFSILTSLVGCNTQGSEGTTAPVNPIIGGEVKDHTPAPVEDKLPAVSGNNIRMYYDDRFALSELVTGEITSVEIVQQPTASDTSVIYYRKADRTLIAVGIGTAEVTVNGTKYKVAVEAAPISLFMITGHSIGAGQEGNAAQSVLCKEGTAYSMHGTAGVSTIADGVGIGYASQIKPKGIDAFTTIGEGTIGEGSGLAYQWNQITGEKVWVLNAAVGGSCLPDWVAGQSNYAKAVKLFKYAQKVLSNEIAAGHYRLKDMAIIYHSGANFAYKNVTYTQADLEAWYRSMWDGFKKSFTMDMDGDGKTETVKAMGLVPIWTPSNNTAYNDDKNCGFYMAASYDYPDIFMASLATRKWLQAEEFISSFPDITYTANNAAVVKPGRPGDMYAPDRSHLVQVTYNALGMDIADNLFSHLRTYTEIDSLVLHTENGKILSDKVTLRVGETLSVVPVVEPINVYDLTFVVSENLSVSYPYFIKAESAGTGTLSIYQENRLLRTVTITIN